MAASKLSKFMPSQEFFSSIKSSSNGQNQQKFIDRILKELELVAYFHKRVPEIITDKQWQKLLRTKTVAERVAMIEYFALTERRKILDEETNAQRKKDFDEKMAHARANFEDGKMGYGNGLHQLVMNPFRYDKNLSRIDGFHQYTSRLLRETPKIALDCQYFDKMSVRDSSKMGMQVEYCLTENITKFRSPFHLELLNLNEKQTLIKEHMPGALNHLDSKFAHQKILPDLYEDMHYKPKDPNVYYVTKDAREFFDGPLDPNKTIILPVTTDRDHEALSTAKKFKFTPIYIPVRKYIKWEVGHFYLPLPNILRMFKMVAETGGDWGSAIDANVAYRHKVSIEVRRENLKGRYDQKQQAIRERHEIIKMIESTVKD